MGHSILKLGKSQANGNELVTLIYTLDSKIIGVHPSPTFLLLIHPEIQTIMEKENLFVKAQSVEFNPFQSNPEGV